MRKVFLFLLPALLLGAALFFLLPYKGKVKRRAQKPLEEKPFVILIPSYNNSAFCEQNLLSVLTQEYRNFRIVYIDDCSTDDTFEKVKGMIQRSALKERITLIHNKKNLGSLCNLYNAIQGCSNEEIVVIVDGDDFLAHRLVLKKLNRVYSDSEVWMTYGNYLDYPSYTQNPQICKPFPRRVIKSRSYRQYPWVSSHLRTFYAGLFKKIAREDLLHGGNFFSMGGDVALMLPLLEMAGEHCRFIDEVLYLYNRLNPLNDHKVNVQLQAACAAHIRELPAYSPLKDCK